jgi:hypothetical protein
MNAIKKLIGPPGVSLKKALLQFNRLNVDKKIRVINSLGKNLQLAESVEPHGNIGDFETKFSPVDIEITFNSSAHTIPMRKVFPYAWLRDNCRCPKCYNYLADEIERDLHSLTDDLKPIHFKSLASPTLADQQSNQIEITCN